MFYKQKLIWAVRLPAVAFLALSLAAGTVFAETCLPAGGLFVDKFLNWALSLPAVAFLVEQQIL